VQSEFSKNDLDISAGFYRGERWAFDAVAKTLFLPIVNFIHHLLHDRDRAVDLAQEAFFLACRAHQKVDPNRSLTPWIFQIARNLAYKEYNKRKKSKQVSLDEMIEDETTSYEPSTNDNPRDESVDQEVWDRLQVAMKRLKSSYRDILILRLIQGLPSEQVSSMLKIPVSTVNTRTHRALKMLRKLARQEGISEDEVFS
jgi:RNA polymerase sigma-70 factor (ECF subfamily)